MQKKKNKNKEEKEKKNDKKPNKNNRIHRCLCPQLRRLSGVVLTF